MLRLAKETTESKWQEATLRQGLWELPALSEGWAVRTTVEREQRCGRCWAQARRSWEIKERHTHGESSFSTCPKVLKYLKSAFMLVG